MWLIVTMSIEVSFATNCVFPCWSAVDLSWLIWNKAKRGNKSPICSPFFLYMNDATNHTVKTCIKITRDLYIRMQIKPCSCYKHSPKVTCNLYWLIPIFTDSCNWILPYFVALENEMVCTQQLLLQKISWQKWHKFKNFYA